MSVQMNGIADTEEVCPVCKTSSYLNKGLRFLVNPECYHRMCESCVDRIFSQGPAQCPIAGCKRTLRKHRFRKQTFEDLSIEREVDIRKRVMAILNRREDEFETKRDWDDFLELREEMVTNLVTNTDVAATEKKLSEYAASNEASIKMNAALERRDSENVKKLQAEEELVSRTRKEAVRQAYEDERKTRAQERVKVLDQMAAGQYDAEAVRHERLKSSARRPAVQAPPAPGGLQIKGIRQRPLKSESVKVEYDPFMGLPIKRGYYSLQDDYPSKTLSKAKNDTRVLTGGYDFKAFYDESLLKAFAGLGCFIDDEIAARDSSSTSEVRTAVAAIS